MFQRTTVVGSNASELEGHHATLKAWAKSEGIQLPPIGHNEVIGPSYSLSPAANLAFLSTLERVEAEHSCRACWTDTVTKQSPCNDNTLDALLTDDCPRNHSLGPNKGYNPPWYVRAQRECSLQRSDAYYLAVACWISQAGALCGLRRQRASAKTALKLVDVRNVRGAVRPGDAAGTPDGRRMPWHCKSEYSVSSFVTCYQSTCPVPT